MFYKLTKYNIADTDTFDDDSVWEVIVTVCNDDDVAGPEPKADLDANINQNTIFPAGHISDKTQHENSQELLERCLICIKQRSSISIAKTFVTTHWHPIRGQVNNADNISVSTQPF